LPVDWATAAAIDAGNAASEVLSSMTEAVEEAQRQAAAAATDDAAGDVSRPARRGTDGAA
jgi:hypothetical protein